MKGEETRQKEKHAENTGCEHEGWRKVTDSCYFCSGRGAFQCTFNHQQTHPVLETLCQVLRFGRARVDAGGPPAPRLMTVPPDTLSGVAVSLCPGGGERGPRAEHAFGVRGRTCVGILQLFRGTLTHYVFESSSFRLQNGVKTPVSSKHSLTTDLLSSCHSTTYSRYLGNGNENTQNLTSTPSPHSRVQWT